MVTPALPPGLHDWREAPRVRALNDRVAQPGGRYVLCWLQQALRARDNPVIDASIRLGNAIGLPVLVYHGVREDYPYASDRLHRFILGASRDLGAGCRDRGVACVQHVDRAGHREKGLVHRLGAEAAAIVLEDGRWLDDAAAAAGVPKSSLTVTAGAIPDTTLITVSVEADSAKAAEAGLQSVLGHALNQAAQVSGPFKLEVIASPEGSAQPQSPRPVELVAAFGVAGLLVGAGAGLLVSRALQARNPQTVGGRRRARRARRDQAESGTNSFRAQTVGDPPDITTPRR